MALPSVTILLATLLLWVPAAALAGGDPLIVIPGDGGCQLEARLVGKPRVKHWWCAKDSSWFRLWLDVKQLLPGQVDCWADNMRQVYEAASPTREAAYVNSPGVEVRVPGWGETHSVEYLDPVFGVGESAMFAELVKRVTAAGALRNQSVRAAPYDFRRIPTPTFHHRLRLLVEDTVALNSGARVALVSHSMGCLVASAFLASVTEDWKATHLSRWVGVSCAFGGSVSMLHTMASGNNLGVSAVKPSAVREEQRSSEANFWLLPSPEVFHDSVLATTGHRNYSAREMDAFFGDIGFAAGWEQYRRVRELTRGALGEAPGVPFVHFYGTEVDTPAVYSWPSAEFSEQPRVSAYTSGDGTLSLRSLKAVAEAWAEQRDGVPGYQAKEYPGETHTGILKSEQFLDDLLATLGWAPGGGSSSSTTRRFK